MRNFFLGCVCGLLVGVIGATAALSGAQSRTDGITSPYDSSMLMGQTNLYNAILSLQAEQLRQRDRASYPDYGGISIGGDRPCR